MNTTFNFIIRTPEAQIVNKQVESVYLATETGDMMLLPNHAAFGGVITYTPVRIKYNNQEEEYMAYRGTVFFSNEENRALLLCHRCDFKDKVDYNGLKSYLKIIEELIEKGEDLSEYHIRFLEGEKLALVQQIDRKEK